MPVCHTDAIQRKYITKYKKWHVIKRTHHKLRNETRNDGSRDARKTMCSNALTVIVVAVVVVGAMDDENQNENESFQDDTARR